MNAFVSIDPTLYKHVIVLGPSHHLPINYCTIAAANRAETPYGEIPFYEKAVQEIFERGADVFRLLDCDTAAEEHSLEMEFPLLKFVFREEDFDIVPIMVGSLSLKQCERVAEVLKVYAEDPETLFVISSDFCHWGARFGFTYLPSGKGEIHERIEEMDRAGADQIATGNPQNFYKYLKETGNTICGRNAILIMMYMFPELKATFPAYSQSSRITSRRDSSVSYMAGIIRLM